MIQGKYHIKTFYEIRFNCLPSVIVTGIAFERKNNFRGSFNGGFNISLDSIWEALMTLFKSNQVEIFWVAVEEVTPIIKMIASVWTKGEAFWLKRAETAKDKRKNKTLPWKAKQCGYHGFMNQEK